jgi:hypothetical protein
MKSNKDNNTNSESNSDGLVLPENTDPDINANTEDSYVASIMNYSTNESYFPIGTDVDTMFDAVEQNRKCGNLSNIYRIHLDDLNTHSFFPENESLAYNNELLCEQMENASARFTKDMTNRSKCYADEAGDMIQVQECDHFITNDISYNASDSWFENIVNTLARGQWFDGEIGGALQFRLVRYNGKRYGTNWGGENRHRGLVSFMRKGSQIINDNCAITYDKMQRKIMIDWNNQNSVKQAEKVDLEKILRTFQVKVQEGKNEFKFLNHTNIKSLIEICGECRKFIEKIERTAFIPFKVSNMDDEMISNDVVLESEQKTGHTRVQKSQEFIVGYFGRDLERDISRRNILALVLQSNRDQIKFLKADQTKESPVNVHSHSPRMSIIYDGKNGTGFQCTYKARFVGPILATVNPETAEKIDSDDPLEPWQMKLLKQYDGIPIHQYKQKVDSHVVSLSISKGNEKETEEFKEQLGSNLRKSAESVLKVNKVFMDEVLDEDGKLIRAELTKYDSYQVVERMMFNIPCKLKEYCQKKPHGTKREIVRITKENYASQIINFRIPLFVRNGDLKVKDVGSFLTKVEGELYDNMFSSINAGEYDMLLDNTSNFMLMYDNKAPKNSKKANKTRRFSNAKCVTRRGFDERINKFRTSFIDNSSEPDRDLTRMEFFGAIGEADLSTGLDTWAYIFDNEVVKLLKDFSPDKRKEDLRSLKREICTELLGIFADKDADIPYDRLVKSEYVVVNLVDAQYAPCAVRIYETDLESDKLDCHLAHWVAEKYCRRTEQGNFVVPCSADANNHKSTRNHDLFKYIVKCMDVSDVSIRFYTKVLFDASLRVQGINVTVDEIIENFSLSDCVGSHYEKVSDKKDAIDKFHNVLQKYNVK